MKIKLGTESLARTSARHPWFTIGAWVGALAVLFFIIATLLNGALTQDNNMTNDTPSKRADTVLADRLGKTENINEMIIVNSETLTVDDPAFQAQVQDLYNRLIDLGNDVVLGGVTYYMAGDPSMVSSDRHSTLISFLMPLDGNQKIDQIYKITDEITAAGTFTIYNTGTASFGADTTALAEETMKTGETVGIAVALIVLAIVFGAVAAALLPIALGIVAIIAALGLTALAGQLMDISFTVTNIITMMGLAVGIDYSLFIVTRFREERQHGKNKIEAIAATGATATRAVFFSGITVMLALTSLVIFPMTMFQTMGVGALLVVLTAITATMTLLPALLSLLGDKVNSLRIPLIQRKHNNVQNRTPSGFWVKTTNLVTRRPIISIAIVVVILLAATVPFFSRNTGMSGISGVPDDLRAKAGFLFLQKEFHLGMDSPAMVVVDGDINSSTTQVSVARLQEIIAADAVFTGSHVAAHPDKNLAVVYAGLAGDPLSMPSMDAVERLRSDYVPTAFEGTNLSVNVTGQTAGILDFNSTTNAYTPIVFAFVLSLSFIILALAFRSIVIPATAIVMNMLSVGAAYGLMVLVFQEGVGASFFGFMQVDVIESWLPLFLFALLFGLSMDYHVFLLSRIREHYQVHGNNTEAVSFGLRSTGKLITGAALIMVAVFGGFALGDMVMFQQMGFGLAVAVFLDATLVRSVLVPATMKLLGEHNWYLPKWLSWLPNISLGENIAGYQKPSSVPEPAFTPGPIPELVPVTVEVNRPMMMRKKD